jgi:hypothetical protein
MRVNRFKLKLLHHPDIKWLSVTSLEYRNGNPDDYQTPDYQWYNPLLSADILITDQARAILTYWCSTALREVGSPDYMLSHCNLSMWMNNTKKITGN